MYWQISGTSRKHLRAVVNGKLIELMAQKRQKNGDSGDSITDSTDSV